MNKLDLYFGKQHNSPRAQGGALRGTMPKSVKPLSQRAHAGLFMAIEGTDGAGTSTQAKRLVRALKRQGRAAIFTYEPSPLRVGRYIRDGLREQPGPSPECLALMFAADRLDHYERTIAPALAAGAVVVSDRYVLSSLAYQGVEADADWVALINSRAPAPDLTIFLHIDEAEAARRRQKRGKAADRFEVSPTQRRVAERYRSLIQDLPQERLLSLSGQRPIAALHREILATVQQRLRPTAKQDVL